MLKLLPSGALSDGLRTALGNCRPRGGLPAMDLLVLVIWAVAGIAVAARAFRWE